MARDRQEGRFGQPGDRHGAAFPEREQARVAEAADQHGVGRDSMRRRASNTSRASSTVGRAMEAPRRGVSVSVTTCSPARRTSTGRTRVRGTPGPRRPARAWPDAVRSWRGPRRRSCAAASRGGTPLRIGHPAGRAAGRSWRPTVQRGGLPLLQTLLEPSMTDVRFRHSAGVAHTAARQPTFAPESAPERPRSVLSSSTGLFGRGGMQAAHGGAGIQPRSALPGMAPHGHASRDFHPGALHGPAHGFGHAAHLQPPAHTPPPMHFQAFQPPAYAAPHYGMGHGATRPTPRRAMRSRRSSNSTRTTWRSRAAPSTTRRQRTAWRLRAGGRSTPSSTARRCCNPR